MNQTDIDTKRKRTETAVKVAGLCAAAFFAAPIIFTVIQGLVGFAIAGAIGIGLIFGTPVVARMAANWRLKAIKAEAARNPVETLQNEYIQRQQAMVKFRTSITDFATEVANFQSKLVGFKKKYPDEAEKFDDQYAKMKRLQHLREDKLQEVAQSLANYAMEIKKAQAIWEMGQAAAAMNKAAGMTEDDFLQKISVETAMDTVEKTMNRAFAELETSLAEQTPTIREELDDQRQLEVEESK